MLSKTPDCVVFSMFVLKYIGPQPPDSVTYSLSFFTYNLHGPVTGGLGPISSCSHSAGDRSPQSTA